MKDFIKFIIKWFMRLGLHIFWILPIKSNCVYFTSFHGARYSCNPKYLYLFMIENYENEFDYIWEFQDVSKQKLVPNARCVKTKSFSALIAMLTSRFIVTNNDLVWYIPLRKNQKVVQTWHGGGAYKRVGVYEKWGKIFALEQKLIAEQISYYISSNQKFTEVQGSSKWVPEKKFISTGMPRNEIFFYLDKVKTLGKRVFDFYKFNSDYKLILYAPTFRGKPTWKENGDKSGFDMINFSRLIENCEKRFGGKWQIMYRGHHVDSNLSNKFPSFVIDATKYEDMQELLCAADVLVTDYSSSMWDYALTGRPCFLYVPDLQEYIADRGFYTEPSSWPGILAKTEDELEQCVLGFDAASYSAKVKAHLEALGSYENKGACEKVCKLIFIDK